MSAATPRGLVGLFLVGGLLGCMGVFAPAPFANGGTFYDLGIPEGADPGPVREALRQRLEHHDGNFLLEGRDPKIQVRSDHPADLSSLLTRRGVLTFHRVDEAWPPQRLEQEKDKAIEAGLTVVCEASAHGPPPCVVLSGDPIVIGIADAKVTEDPTGMNAVVLELTPDGGTRFHDLSKKALKERIAMVLDGELLSAPMVMEPIPGGRIHIASGFDKSPADVEAMATLLRGPPLPVAVELLRTGTIDPPE